MHAQELGFHESTDVFSDCFSSSVNKFAQCSEMPENALVRFPTSCCWHMNLPKPAGPSLQPEQGEIRSEPAVSFRSRQGPAGRC